MSRNVNPRPQFLDSAGDPLGLGKMYYFDSGTDTAKVTFADVNQTIANTHPVLLTADGRLPNVFFSGSARQKLTDSDDVQLWDIDPVGADDIGANFDDWNPLIIYDANDIVQGSNDRFYISINAGNQNNDPTTTPSEWAEIEFINIWNVNVTYQIGNTVKGSDNLFYISLTANNLGNDPVGDVVNWGPPFVGVGSVVAGTGITVDASDPQNPIVAAINNGDVVGPVSSVDNEIALFSGATGKLLKAGPVTGTASGNVPLVGTKSSTETLAGLVEKSTSAENIAATDDTVWPTVAGAKEILDTFALRQASNLSDVASAATSRTNLGVEIGTDVAALTGSNAAIESFVAAVSNETSPLTTGTAKITFRMPYAFTLTGVRASVTTAPTGSVLTVDINEGGVTILSTKLTIDVSEKTSTTAATPPVISDASLADDAEITVDIDTIGSTIAGAGLKVYLIGQKT